MINYGRQSINSKDIKSVIETLKSNFLTQGPTVEKFEIELKKLFKSKLAIAVSSGTAALNIIAKILKWKKNDVIFVSPITFISSANCILHVNATPHFVDINMEDYSIDLNKLEREIIKLRNLGKRLRAVIVTDYAGHPSDWIRLNKIKKKYKISLINDSCHAIGASINNNFGYAVKYADFVALSFHPVKNITTGEGGAILTNKSKYLNNLISLRSNGVIKRKKMIKKNGPWFYEMKQLGNNYRLSDIHAALGISQIKRLKKFVKKRNTIAKFYNRLFSNNKIFTIPSIKKNFFHSFHLYPLLVDFNKLKKSKKKVYKEFLKYKIRLQVHYIPVNMQPYYKKKIKFIKNNYFNSIKFYNNEISMPIYYDLSTKELEYIKKACKKIFNIQ